MPNPTPQNALAECIDRMESLMAQAAAIMRHGDSENLRELKPLRLRMAGAITSFQVALDRVSVDPGTPPMQAAAAHDCGVAWKDLGNDFRAFALLNQSTSPQAWAEYRASAALFMLRIKAQIRAGRKCLVDDDRRSGDTVARLISARDM